MYKNMSKLKHPNNNLPKILNLYKTGLDENFEG